MRISFDWGGCYLEHREAFNAMANAMNKDGHEVGIITGERQHRKEEILNSLGFDAKFISLWGDDEPISNGSLWKCEQMDALNVVLHFDDDAREMKKYTPRWVVKVLNSGDINKF